MDKRNYLIILYDFYGELLNDKQKLALFGHEARLNAEDYSYDSVKEKWLSIINDILN